jgi:acyl-CoA synthetase (AMP-forming)/AMP-acid ligase II/thioesterase domain-containing protein/acyl carrier protein
MTIARIAGRFPDRCALELSDRKVTYRQLDVLADRLAQRLIDETEGSPDRGLSSEPVHPPGAQSCIPIMVESTEALLVAVEAVRRTASVSVPIDPNTPASRIQHILGEVKAPLVLSDMDPDGLDGTTLLHPLEDGVDAPFTVERPPGRLGSIVYTSGSTGSPKGVMTGPGQYQPFVDTVAAIFGEDEPVRLGIVMAGSAAASVPIAGLFVTCGWTLVPFEVRRQTSPVGPWLQGAGVTAFATVPTIARQVLASLGPNVPIPGLQYVGLFGETTTWEDVAGLRTHMEPGGTIFNVYGQTESGDVALMAVGSDMPLGTGRLPVGSPLPGRRVSIIDEDGTEVPPGEPGEIVVHTQSSSLGYWNDDAASSGVFLPHADGSTIVHTGDAGRIGPDGVIEHLGRLDRMVKVAGNRVDLTEIETVLRTYHYVTDAAATTYRTESGELRLRAFVTMEPSRVANPRALRGWIRQRVPRAVVPDTVEVLSDLPKLPNGKLDRDRLPTAPPRGNRGSPTSGPPASPMEERVAAIWSRVLGVDDVDPDDNFFDLGGDSLRAVNLLGEMEGELGTDVPLWLVLEHPTPRGMASALKGPISPTPVVSIQAHGSGLPLFVVHDSYGNLFGAQHYLDAIGLDQPILGLRADAWERGAVMEPTLERLAARYASSVHTVQPLGALCLYGQGSGATIAFEVARQLRARGRTVALLLIGEGGGPPLPTSVVLRDQIAELRALPVGQLPRTAARLGGRATRRLAALARARVRGLHQPLAPTVPEVAVVDRAAYAHHYYGTLIRAYRPTTTYEGAALVVEPPWTPPGALDRWRYWVSGPLRFADPDTLRQEFRSAAIRAVERLAP